MSGKKNTENNKIKALESLERSRGNISIAAEKCNLSRQTIHIYIKEDVAFSEAFDMINEGAIDYVESKLFELIEGVTMAEELAGGEMKVYTLPPSVPAVLFYLKTKAKHRGYVERTEFTGKDGKALGKWEVEVIDIGHEEIKQVNAKNTTE